MREHRVWLQGGLETPRTTRVNTDIRVFVREQLRGLIFLKTYVVILRMVSFSQIQSWKQRLLQIQVLILALIVIRCGSPHWCLEMLPGQLPFMDK
jgi:hypothetical protein